jgi:DNA-binding XRE family transcriptional regulator
MPARRPALGLTRAGAAAAAGVTLWTWTRFEGAHGRARHLPAPAIAGAIARVLGCSLAALYRAAGLDLSKTA